MPYKFIEEVIRAVDGNIIKEGMVPVENIKDGLVEETVMSLYHASKARIRDEYVLPISFALGILPETRDIKYVLSKGIALEQCKDYLREKYPNAEPQERPSTVASLEEIVNKNLIGYAALAPLKAIRKYNLMVIEEDLPKNSNNRTRFFVVGRGRTKKSHHDKTSLIIYPKIDREGLLRDLLNFPANFGINLESIHSHPDGTGKYLFYFELYGHEEDIKVKKTLENMKFYTEHFLLDSKENGNRLFKILGSYKKAANWVSKN